jgi:hypothetical protein
MIIAVGLTILAGLMWRKWRRAPISVIDDYEQISFLDRVAIFLVIVDFL